MTDWKTYYLQTKDLPPSPLLVKALPYVEHHERALDIGGGALKDTRYLLEEGFEVTVIDQDESLIQMASALESPRLHATITTFETYSFPIGMFDLASAMFALPFNHPGSFTQVFSRIKQSLITRGIFCGQFFGVRDEWVKSQQMTFHSKEQVEMHLAGMEVILLAEREFEGKLASGLPKHWHLFDVIARKI